MSGDNKQPTTSRAKKIDKTTWQTEGIACLKCKVVLDCHTKVQSEKGDYQGPEPGSLTICINCGTLMQYQEDETDAVLVDEKRLKFVPFDINDVEDVDDRNKLRLLMVKVAVAKSVVKQT